MPIIETDSQAFEPYARLINIIGDQLITDKKVAVIELIKNCYDADAENVFVRFVNMDNYNKSYLTKFEQAYIEIEDDGDGMTLDTIKNVWLRLAAPVKLDKRKTKKDFSKKGRILQGEKGIGRFAVHKLGEDIDIFTKAKGNNEIKLELDFSKYDPEKLDLFNQPPQKHDLLKDVYNHWYVYSPPEVIKKSKGTIIRIYSLRERWTDTDFKDLYKAINKLIPPYDPFAKEFDIDFATDFDIKIYLNDHIYSSEGVVTFEEVIDEAPFKMSGSISKDGILTFNYISELTNRKLNRSVSILKIEELASYSYDLKSRTVLFPDKDRIPQCGSFKFSLYAYDLGKKAELSKGTI